MTSNQDTKRCPRRQESSFIQHITYSYVSPLLKLGQKILLQLDHYPLVEDVDEADTVALRLNHAWEQEKLKHSQNPKIWKAAAKTFGTMYLLGGFLFFLESVSRLAQAIFLAYLLNFFSDPNASLKDGFLYALGLILNVLFCALSHHINFFYCMRSGMQMRIGFITLLYKKILNLSMSHTSSSGIIVNMASNDVQRFEDASPFANFIWLGPLEVLMATYFMYLQISWAAFAAVGALLLLIPIQGVFASQFGKLRKKTVLHRDDRIRNISDLLTGIMIVKLYAWEKPFSKKINDTRNEEMKYIRKAAVLRAANEAFWFASSAIICAFAFITFYLIGGVFTPARVFSTITVLLSVRLSMTNFFPKALQFVSESIVSLNRIQSFLLLPEIESQKENDMDPQLLNQDPKTVIAFECSSFSWDSQVLKGMLDNFQHPKSIKNSKKNNNNTQKNNDTAVERVVDESTALKKDNGNHDAQPKTSTSKRNDNCGIAQKIILNNMSLDIKEKDLVFVVGPVGAGKSSFLNAILGEMVKLGGRYCVKKNLSIAYASQNPWIINGTVRENIMFGRPYDKEWFQQVLEACSMIADLETFANGEMTFIGERGVNLSGGQKARLALARALYSKADIYLLDDPLSAVDAKVGRHIFNHCIEGLMKDSARVLVTHQLQYIVDHHRVLFLEDGKVLGFGNYNDIISQVHTPFMEAMLGFVSHTGQDRSDEEEEHHSQKTIGESLIQQFEILDEGEDDDRFRCESTEFEHEPNANKVIGSQKEKFSQGQKEDSQEHQKKEDEQYQKELKAQEEKSAVGSVTWKTYYQFFTAGSNGFVVSFLFFALVLGQCALIITDYWLARWSVQTPAIQSEKGSQNAWIYGLLVLATFSISLGRSIMFFMICISSTRKIFVDMLQSVVRSPMHFFQTNPVGRLMNRFSKDLNIADEMLPLTFFDFLQCAFMIIGTIITAVVVIPYILIVVPFVFAIFYWLRKYFVTTSRQIKRMEATTRSPVYSSFTSTLEGLPIIRAFKAEKRFLSDFTFTQNENTRVYFSFMSSSRWLGIRLDTLAASFTIVVTFVAVGFKQSLNNSPGLIGLVLSYCIQLLGLLQWGVRQSAEVENLMISAERCLEYTNLEPEANEITHLRPASGWPQKGTLNIQHLNLSYASNEKPTLNDISIHVPGGTKVGIVGRTGAGKSSFLQALFRLVEPQPHGCIKIDGLDISEIGLYDLRSSISIIPQEPFCFKGTLRFNIDPFNRYTDDQIWRTLEAVELKQVIENHHEKLEAPVSENGGNWSFGERQLICLARAILKNTNLIVMDEATSAVDMRTDALVQKAIRSTTSDRTGGLFKNATVITIAHRINTVIDFDRIMVLDKGKLVEFGHPYELLMKNKMKDESAWFRRMVDEMGQEARESLLRIAKLKYEENIN